MSDVADRVKKIVIEHLGVEDAQVHAGFAGELSLSPRALVVDHVRDVLRDYAHACGEVVA